MNSAATELERLSALGPFAPVENPYDLYRNLRDESPIVALDGGSKVFVMRYDDVREVLADHERFSNAAIQKSLGLAVGPTLLGMDGEAHLRHRALVTPALAPRSLRGEFPRLVERVAHEHIDAFAGAGHAELCADFAFTFPLTVMVEILGLSPERVQEFHRLSIDLMLVTSDPVRGMKASEQIRAALVPVFEEKMGHPGEGLIGSLLTAEVDGHRLSELDVASIVRLLVLAGAETTYHLIGSALCALLSSPSLSARVVQDRSLVPLLLMETLRWESPLATTGREAVEDVELRGVRIERGTTVLCHIGSANRDERKYSNPGSFDIDRNAVDHLAFGIGRHYCAGSRLALLEAEIGLNALLDRLGGLRIQSGKTPRIVGFNIRGPEHLNVEFESL
ncbi:MAG: cytochrome P450 [bacterium]|nr:cytochrome P450 [bacterium]